MPDHSVASSVMPSITCTLLYADALSGELPHPARGRWVAFTAALTRESLIVLAGERLAVHPSIHEHFMGLPATGGEGKKG